MAGPRLHCFLASAFLLYLCKGNAIGEATWPMYRRSPSHDAHTSVNGPSTNSTAWTFQADGAIYGSPVLGNGFVYFGTYVAKAGTLYAVNAATGELAWSYKATGPIGSTPTLVIEEQMLLVGVNDGHLDALDALSGALLWSFKPSTDFRSYQLDSSVLYHNGRAYFGSLDSKGDIFAVTVTRKSHGDVWKVKTGAGAVGAGVPGSPAFADGVLYVGANDGDVHAINEADGTSVWSAQTHSIVYSSPALSPDHTKLFVGSNDGNLYSFNTSNGAQLWSMLTPGWVDSSPALDGKGNVFVSTSNGNGPQNFADLYSVNADTGKVQWSINLPEADGLYNPVVAGALVCAGSMGMDTTGAGNPSSFGCWTAASGKRVWKASTGGHLGAAAAVGSGGELYIGDQMGKLFKFAPQANPATVLV